MIRRPQRLPDVLAAVDLGSNSFHMVVARSSSGQLIVIDRLRETVRLASGQREDGRLDESAAERALACMERFGQRLAQVRADAVRVVGTSALRRARPRQSFLERARDALGHPVEVIAGREEARLIYSGVFHMLPPEPGNRLVVDIGGGSTELIIGRGREPLDLKSLEMGCVALSEHYFGEGRLSATRFARARLAARQELESIRERYLSRGWECAAGSSGSVHAVLDALKEIDPRTTVITREGIESLIDLLVSAGHVDAIALQSLTEERRGVFAGGLAVLAEVFSQLKVREMRWSEGAMREGILYDMLSGGADADARDRAGRDVTLS